LGTVLNFAETSSFERINYLHDFQFSKATWEEAERPFFQILPLDNVPATPLPIGLLTEWEIGTDQLLIEQLKTNANLYAQLEVLSLLSFRHDLDYDTGLSAHDGTAGTVRELLEEVYQRAGDQHVWYIIRRGAGLLGKYDINLEQAATEILVRQHALTLGRAYSSKATLTRPADSSEILQKIRTYNVYVSEQIIIQELIIYLGMLIKSNQILFADMYTVRVGHILQLLIVRQQRESACSTLDQAFNEILSLPPYQLAGKVKETLEDFSHTEEQLDLAKTLHYEGPMYETGRRELTRARFSKNMDAAVADDWYVWREQQGSVGRENEAFYTSVWTILHHCKGLTIGEKLNSKNRLDSENTLSQMTPGEQSFKLSVNHLLNKIQAPVYRQLTVEALKTLASIFRENISLHIDDTLLMEIIIEHAVRISWLQTHAEHEENYDAYEPLAWKAFNRLAPHQVANGILDALMHLLNTEKN
jgi:phosphorylase kinase alpha/beta subunit